MRRDKEKLNLACILTNEEKLNISSELADNISRKNRLEDEIKDFKSQKNSEIQRCDSVINLNSEKISTGKEFRDVECRIEYDWGNKLRRWIRVDTEEIAKEDIISEQDLQEHLSV